MPKGSAAAKPALEEVLRTALDGESAASALAFAAFLRSLRMSPQWASKNSWSVSCKGKRVCYIKLTAGGGWYIRPAVQYDDALRSFCQAEGLEAVMLANVHRCTGCGKCAPGRATEFFGITVENACCSPIDFEFHNPSEIALDCAKKMILYRRAAIMAASTNSKG